MQTFNHNALSIKTFSYQSRTETRINKTITSIFIWFKWQNCWSKTFIGTDRISHTKLRWTSQSYWSLLFLSFSVDKQSILILFQKSERLRQRRSHYSTQLETLKQVKYNSEPVKERLFSFLLNIIALLFRRMDMNSIHEV